MAHPDVVRLTNGGEVEPFVPGQEQGQVLLKLGQLGGRKGDTKGDRGRDKILQPGLLRTKTRQAIVAMAGFHCFRRQVAH